MPRYSFIVPVYNTQQYLSKCLDSLVKQTFKDYEIIIINDGTKDNSQTIIDEYVKRSSKIKAYKKSNGGLSDARNYGVKKATGDYLIFVDSDDYVSKDMLKAIDFHINENQEPDIIKFSYANVVADKIMIEENQNIESIYTGIDAFTKLVSFNQAFEMACLYAYNRKFWLANKFKYALGKYHEDFGLTPLIVLKARKIVIIDEVLYYYVRHEGSITINNSNEKTIKKVYDMLDHFDYLLTKVNNDKKINYPTKRIFNSYIANAVIDKANDLNGDDRKKYIKEIEKRRIKKLLLNDNLKRILKKIVVMISINLYLKLK